MLKRHITPQLARLAAQFPVVTILGPRQSGKTTLARAAFPKHEYLNLELPPVRLAAQSDAVGFFKAHPAPLILDEVQHVPELLSYVQVMADEQKRKGAFILTGSHQPRLAAGITQSLAGRTGLLRLLPFSIAELSDAGVSLERDEYLHRGFMPGVHADGVAPELFYRSYYQTYVERDVRQLINITSQRAFETFVRLLAGRVGQVVNLSSLAGDAGVSSTTLASWLSVLEASFIVFRLPCYFNNFGKRLVKAPKIYFTDVGLAAWLLGIETPAQAARDPLFGGLFENMVVAEALKTRLNAGREPELYYFRDQHGLEVDLVVNKGRRRLPVEIKAGMTYDPSFARNLRNFLKLTDAAESPVVLYGGEQEALTDGVSYANFKETARIIAKFDGRSDR
ncbi:ATP-binding protein [Termitidicoccus mucosus]|uniref:AAA family ATPase n=1 Tax=Termitidicoccus mucosus TaxID=1184151 RepID=A0A178IFY7_9BACT|nr:AAA family ATPase [Opitutaceae bacterium TSB47]